MTVPRDPYYDTAQICLSGHVITAAASRSPHRMQGFCDECGERTILACPNCDGPIRGLDLKGSVGIMAPYIGPKFCHACGTPYPWTETRLIAAREYAEELQSLDQEEKALLKKSLDQIVRDTPQTQVAAVRIKKLLVKMGPVAAGVMRDIIVDLGSEAAKKILLQ